METISIFVFIFTVVISNDFETVEIAVNIGFSVIEKLIAYKKICLKTFQYN